MSRNVPSPLFRKRAFGPKLHRKTIGVAVVVDVAGDDAVAESAEVEARRHADVVETCPSPRFL